jgi:hypothetical protein
MLQEPGSGMECSSREIGNYCVVIGELPWFLAINAMQNRWTIDENLLTECFHKTILINANPVEGHQVGIGRLSSFINEPFLERRLIREQHNRGSRQTRWVLPSHRL